MRIPPLTLAALFVALSAVRPLAQDVPLPDDAPPPDEPETRNGDGCPGALRAKLQAANLDTVCATLLADTAPGAGGNVVALYDIEEADLGGSEKGWLFRHKTGGDPYAFRPSFLFVPQEGALRLVFDGEGKPSSLAPDRPRVNGRFQIERTALANVPGLYKKSETETWFWTGDRYARAFTRTSIEGAKDPALNGTKTAWNPEAEETYRKAGVSWSYTIKAGDTLGGVARKQGVSAGELARQNGIGERALLRLGQVLRYDSWKINAR